MKTKKSAISVLAIGILIWMGSPTHAQISHLLRYQGTLVDSADIPLEGPYHLTFRMYDAPTGGNLVWGPESHISVPVTKGTFSVLLGSITTMGLLFDTDCYLSVEVNSDGEMSPRQRITPVANAIRSETSEDTEKLAGNVPTYYLDRINHTGTQSPSSISPQGSGSGLNADKLDGLDTSFFLSRGSHTGTQLPSTITPQGAGSGLNADAVDGLDSSQLGHGTSGSFKDHTDVNASVSDSAAQGDLLIRGASDWTRLPAGEAGKYLMSQGGGNNPVWATSSNSTLFADKRYWTGAQNNSKNELVVTWNFNYAGENYLDYSIYTCRHIEASTNPFVNLYLDDTTLLVSLNPVGGDCLQDSMYVDMKGSVNLPPISRGPHTITLRHILSHSGGGGSFNRIGSMNRRVNLYRFEQ